MTAAGVDAPDQAAQDGRQAADALRLLGKWNRVSAGHLAFGASCGCAPGSEGISVSGFEEMIVEFLLSRHGAAMQAVPGLRDFGGQAADPGVLGRLLAALARGAAPPDLGGRMLADLTTSIDSFDALHGLATG